MNHAETPRHGVIYLCAPAPPREQRNNHGSRMNHAETLRHGVIYLCAPAPPREQRNNHGSRMNHAETRSHIPLCPRASARNKETTTVQGKGARSTYKNPPKSRHLGGKNLVRLRKKNREISSCAFGFGSSLRSIQACCCAAQMAQLPLCHNQHTWS
jgi:hypothetical protein